MCFTYEERTSDKERTHSGPPLASILDCKRRYMNICVKICFNVNPGELIKISVNIIGNINEC